jgi:hypothetical protein
MSYEVEDAIIEYLSFGCLEATKNFRLKLILC